MVQFSELAKSDCEECDGEGIVSYAQGDDSTTLPCQVCFPPKKNQLETTFEDFIDPDEDDG